MDDPNQTVEYVLKTPVIMLASAIMLAILVERLIEFLKNIVDYYSSKLFYARFDENNNDVNGEKDFWTKLAIKISQKLEIRLDNAKSNGQAEFNLVMGLATRYLSPNTGENDGLFAVSAAKIRGIYLKIVLKVLACVLGIILAWSMNIDIVELVKITVGDGEQDINSYDPSVFGFIVTGISIGLGAGPLHKIIVALEDARKKREGRI